MNLQLEFSENTTHGTATHNNRKQLLNREPILIAILIESLFKPGIQNKMGKTSDGFVANCVDHKQCSRESARAINFDRISDINDATLRPAQTCKYWAIWIADNCIPPTNINSSWNIVLGAQRKYLLNLGDSGLVITPGDVKIWRGSRDSYNSSTSVLKYS